MLKRLAVVIWWLGAKGIAAGRIVGGYALSIRIHCASVLAVQAVWQKKVDQLAAKYEKMPAVKVDLSGKPESEIDSVDAALTCAGSCDTDVAAPPADAWDRANPNAGMEHRGAAAFPLECGRARAMVERPKPVGLDDALAQCNSGNTMGRSILAGVLSVAGLALFALAFTVGGRSQIVFPRRSHQVCGAHHPGRCPTLPGAGWAVLDGFLCFSGDAAAECGGYGAESGSRAAVLRLSAWKPAARVCGQLGRGGPLLPYRPLSIPSAARGRGCYQPGNHSDGGTMPGFHAVAGGTAAGRTR